AVDAEVILLAIKLLEGLGLKDLELSINSVGCPECRSQYRTMLQDFFRDKLGDLCEDCKSRFDRSPLRILDCKKDSDKPYMADAPKITDCLCEECSSHFEALKQHLAKAGVGFKHDPRLVRGLDYYTKTAFEIKYPPLGAQSAVAGGGRYDGLIEEMGGNHTPAVGFATGLERLLLALENQNLLPDKNRSVDAYVVALGEKAQAEAFKLVMDLRDAGLSAAIDYAGRSMKAQMKQANKLNAKYAVILGDDEIAEGAALIRSMADSSQEKVAFDAVIEKIKG
ncbi:MAG: histidine--tRNA ligase, partial [Selenomonadaceae bacterium]